MTLAGGAPPEVIAATTMAQTRLTTVFTRTLTVYTEGVLGRLTRQAGRYRVRPYKFDLEPPAVVPNVAALATTDDWHTAVQAGGMADGMDLAYDDIIAAATIEAPVTITADPAAAAVSHIRAIRGWADSMQTEVTDVVTQGVSTGASVKEIGATLADRIEGVDRKRGELIARTEANAAQNAGRTYIHNQTGLPYLRLWVATPDSRIRMAHAEAHGQRVHRDDAFTVGGYTCQYPGDDSLPASLRSNCRCTISVSYDGWSATDLADDRREWAARTRQIAADDGIEIDPALDRVLTSHGSPKA